jgi:RNA-binding protein 23/39
VRKVWGRERERERERGREREIERERERERERDWEGEFEKSGVGKTRKQLEMTPSNREEKWREGKQKEYDWIA